MHLDTALFKTTKTQLKETNLETIKIEPLTNCSVYQSSTEFDDLLKRHVLHAINLHQKENVKELDSWTQEMFHSKLWLYFQADIKSRLEVTISTKTAETARSINNSNYQSMLDNGHLTHKLEFYPNTVKQAVPIGGSILSVLTRDHRNGCFSLILIFYFQEITNCKTVFIPLSWCSSKLLVRNFGHKECCVKLVKTSRRRVCPSG